jgi:alkane 1-monooxygenase
MASPPLPTAISGTEVFHHWRRHLLSFVAPGLALLFVATAPHTWWVALLFLVPMPALELADAWAPDETRQPAADMPRWPFDAMLYALFAAQVAIILLTAQLVSEVGLFSLSGLIALLLVPGSSAFSIITAHELIHRRQQHYRIMGRIMLGLVLYEHFYTEHVRGHHRRVGTRADPATARFGESFWSFYRRTLPGQLKSAWRLETQRLGGVDMRLGDPRMLRSRVLHGVVAEWAFALALLAIFGGAAFAMHLIQAIGAITGLEVVNYFEHWGLERQTTRVQPVDSWDTSNRFTLYGLVGLSRHADHHAHASRPFQQLRHWDESPKLPRGYPGMVRLVLSNNRKFQELLTRELERVRLGPFSPDALANPAAPGATSAAEAAPHVLR